MPGPAPFGSGQHQVEDVLGGVTDIAAGDEPLHALDVPRSVGLSDGLGAARADIGAGIRLGQHHGRRPAPLEGHCRPTLLLFVALDVECVGHRGPEGVPEGGRRIGTQEHLVDRPRQRRGRGNTADLLGDADAPPLGVLDRLHRLGQFAGHADAVVLRVEDRRVAVGRGERLGQRTLRQPGDLVEHRAHRVDIEIAVATRSENVAEIQHLEQVELDVTDIGDVVAQGIFLRLANWRKCGGAGRRYATVTRATYGDGTVGCEVTPIRCDACHTSQPQSGARPDAGSSASTSARVASKLRYPVMGRHSGGGSS